MTERMCDGKMRGNEDKIRASAGNASAPGSSASSEFPAGVPVVSVVLAAGLGTRFDPRNPKQLVSIAGKPVIAWSLEAFEKNAFVTDIILVVNSRVRAEAEKIVSSYSFKKVKAIIDGGIERYHSVRNSIDLLDEYGLPRESAVLFHDGVRPFVSQESINGCIRALRSGADAAAVAVASTDTLLHAVKRSNSAVCESETAGEFYVCAVPNRSEMFCAQTPQAFSFSIIKHAHSIVSQDENFKPTDDIGVLLHAKEMSRDLRNSQSLEPFDARTVIVPGEKTNIKITVLDDLPAAEFYAQNILQKNSHCEISL